MNPSTGTIWMNVTTGTAWSGAPMGIVRVERALEQELAGICGDRFKKCVWRDGGFAPWVPQMDRSDAVRREPPAEPWVVPLLPRRQAVTALAQAILSLAPAALRPILNRGWRSLRPLRAAGGTSATWSPAVAQDPGGLFRRGDVFLTVGTDWDHPFPSLLDRLRRECGVRVVTCCYDLIPVFYPQYCAEDMVKLFAGYFLDLARGSDLVLCISRQTERDFRSFLDQHGVPAPATRVFPLGDNVRDDAPGEVPARVRDLCAGPFILFVSTIERRKNHEVLYRAYHLLRAAGNAEGLPKLVFAGTPGWGVRDFLTDLELDPLTRDLVVVLEGATDDELAALYRHAKFCVFPSFYEGWGLPVGEALAAGKVVVASDRGSLPEVGGDLVRYVDPWNPHAWAAEIRRLLDEPALLASLERRVREGYRPRTWRDCALAVRDAIDALPGVAPSA